MKSAFDEFVVGKFTIVFHDATKVKVDIVRYATTSNGDLICLVDDKGVIYNWRNISLLIPH